MNSLSAIALLAGLPADEIEDLSRRCRRRKYAAGDVIIAAAGDQTQNDVAFVIQGVARVFSVAQPGRPILFTDIGAGGHFGELAALDGGPRTADVTALHNTVVAWLPAAEFERILDNCPIIAKRVMRGLTAMVRRLDRRIVELTVADVTERVRADLLRLAHHDRAAGASKLIKPLPRHSEIGARIGAARESVARSLARLERMGLLERRTDAVFVPDIGALAAADLDARSAAAAAPRKTGKSRSLAAGA